MSTRYTFQRVAAAGPLTNKLPLNDDTMINDGSWLSVLRCRRLVEGSAQGVGIVLNGTAGGPWGTEKVNADHNPHGIIHLNIGDGLVRTRVQGEDETPSETPMDLFAVEEQLFRVMEETLTALATRYEDLAQKKAALGIRKHTLTTLDLMAIRQLMAMQQRLLSSTTEDE